MPTSHAHAHLLYRNSALATKCRTFQPNYLCLGKSFHLAFYGMLEKGALLTFLHSAAFQEWQ